MEVFCSEDQTAVLRHAPAATPRVLPLPSVLDSHVVVLLHLLLQEQPLRPVTLDGSGVRRLCPVAALLLASALRSRCERGAPVQIVRLAFGLRRKLEQHSLAAFVAAPGPQAAGPADVAPAAAVG
jgi:hypothetical protein